MLHLQRTLTGAVADRYGLVVHPKPAARTNNWDFSLQVLLEAELGRPAMYLGLGDAGRIPKGFSVAIHLLLHRIFEEAHVDLVALDDLAQLREVFLPAEGRTDSLHKI